MWVSGVMFSLVIRGVGLKNGIIGKGFLICFFFFWYFIWNV